MRTPQLHDEELCLATIQWLIIQSLHTCIHTHTQRERDTDTEGARERKRDDTRTRTGKYLYSRILLRKEKVRVRESANMIVDASTNETHSPVHGLRARERVNERKRWGRPM